MILSSISHRATVQDCFCIEPGHFVFRLQSAAGDLSHVILHHQDKYLPLKIQDTRGAVAMHKVGTDTIWDYWEAELEFQMVCLRYWFELTDSTGKTVYYANFHFANAPFTDVDDMFDCPQNMREEERFTTPKWAENKVVYQVFPSRFASSRKVPARQWYKAPITSRDNLHGDLRGIIDHLEHIRELGVDILYMTPIFRSDSCHKYDTIDYYQIEPSFGTKEDLKELVDKVHAMGMRIILDAVFNHTSPEFFAFRDIQEKGAESEYLDWYFIESFPLRNKRGQKPNYKTFSYVGGMPKLNLKNPAVARYALDVALYWLRECGIDGWRLDVGDEVGHAFWKQFRREIKSEFPEALIVGEVWHYAEDFLVGDEWDTVMNYPFYRSALGLVSWDSIPVSRFAGDLNYQKAHYHPDVIPLLWNLIDSHDTPRLLHLCHGDKNRMKLAAALQLLLPGMPMIYYGDEYAMEGGQDPDCRRGMVWDPKRQDPDMFAWYCRLIRIRKAYPEILNLNAEYVTSDSSGLLIRKVGDYTLVFHCKSGTLTLPAYSGWKDLISGVICDGSIGPFAVQIFESASLR